MQPHHATQYYKQPKPLCPALMQYDSWRSGAQQQSLVKTDSASTRASFELCNTLLGVWLPSQVVCAISLPFQAETSASVFQTLDLPLDPLMPERRRGPFEPFRHYSYLSYVSLLPRRFLNRPLRPPVKGDMVSARVRFICCVAPMHRYVT